MMRKHVLRKRVVRAVDEGGLSPNVTKERMSSRRFDTTIFTRRRACTCKCFRSSHR